MIIQIIIVELMIIFDPDELHEKWNNNKFIKEWK